jgi:hypothetical protein
MSALEPGDLAQVLPTSPGTVFVTNTNPVGMVVEVLTGLHHLNCGNNAQSLEPGHVVATPSREPFWVVYHRLKKIGDENPNQAIPLADCLFQPNPLYQRAMSERARMIKAREEVFERAKEAIRRRREAKN